MILHLQAIRTQAQKKYGVIDVWLCQFSIDMISVENGTENKPTEPSMEIAQTWANYGPPGLLFWPAGCYRRVARLITVKFQ